MGHGKLCSGGSISSRERSIVRWRQRGNEWNDGRRHKLRWRAKHDNHNHNKWSTTNRAESTTTITTRSAKSTAIATWIAKSGTIAARIATTGCDRNESIRRG